MWVSSPHPHGGSTRFFYLVTGYDSLDNYVKTNFAMMQHHNYSYRDIEDMIPWERIVYVSLITAHTKAENERIRLEQQTRKR